MTDGSTAADGHDIANDSNLARILAVQTIVVALAVTCVSLRLYVRIRLVKGIGPDDWAMAGAALCSIGTWILFVYRGAHGLGRHDKFISEYDQSKVSEAEFWQVIISSCLGIALLKISIALNLLRLSLSRWFTWCLWLSIVFVSAYSFMGAMTFFCYCKPMSAFWDHSIKDATCYSIHLFITFALINTSFNIFTDVLFATLPIPVIWKLQMKHRVRLYLIGVLSLGYIAVAFGVANGVFQIAFANVVDKTYNDWIIFFAVLQVNTGIIAACAPSLKPLVSKALKLSGYNNSRSRGNYNGHYGSRYGSRFTTRPRSTHWHNQYGIEELHSLEDGKKSDEVRFGDKGENYSATATFYKGSDSGTGDNHRSDGVSLGGGPAQRRSNNSLKGDIVLTTEVIVH